MQPSARSQPAILGGESLGQLFWSVICKPCIYALLFGIPRNYQRRLGRADWIQVSLLPWQQGLVLRFHLNLLSHSGHPASAG